MSKNLEFDETETIDEILGRYHDACVHVGIDSTDLAVGEAFIHTFHETLINSVKTGNQARIEKTIGSGQHSLRLIGLPQQQRRGFLHLFSKLFGY